MVSHRSLLQNPWAENPPDEDRGIEEAGKIGLHVTVTENVQKAHS